MGEIFALASAVAWASSVVLFKYAGNSLSAHSLNLVKNVIGVSLLIPTAFLIDGPSLPVLSNAQWVIVVATGFFGIAVADSWYLLALRKLGAGRTAIVGSLYSPFVIFLSIFILAESLQAYMWFGFALVLTGILVVVYQKEKGVESRAQILSGSAYAVCSVFLTALGVVLMKPVLEHDGFFWIVALRMLAGAIGLLLWLKVVGRLGSTMYSLTEPGHKWLVICLASVAGAYLAMMFWLAGFKYTSASVASVLNELSNVFIVLMATLFLKESLGPRKLFGVLFAFLGVFVFLGLLPINWR